MHYIIEEDILRMMKSNTLLEKLYGKTILITGASGYVPAYFVHLFMKMNELNNANIKVLALCRNQSKADMRFEQYYSKPNFALLLQDVCVPVATTEKIDYIIHAASPAGVTERQKNILDTFNANVIGCYNMFELAHKNNVQGFLFVSSVDIYGKVPNVKRHIEHIYGSLDPLNERDVYSNGKRACESICMCESIQNDIPVTIARPTQIIGPGIALNDGRLHADFVNQMMSKGEIVLKSDGTAIRSFIYITDAILGLLYILLYGKKGEAYNVANEENEASVKEFADVMASEYEEKKIEVKFDITQRKNPEVTHALSVVCADAQKLRNLGWKPQISLQESAKRLITYCRNGDL